MTKNSRDRIPADMILTWRINYCLDRLSPEGAGRWWLNNCNGAAPWGAVTALGLCLDEIALLRSEADAAASRAGLAGLLKVPRREALSRRLDYLLGIPHINLNSDNEAEIEALSVVLRNSVAAGD